MKLLLVFLFVVGSALGQDLCPGGIRHQVPDGFEFSTATSAYQVEGGAWIDGKGPSIWDFWTKNARLAKDSGNITCDSYHKYKEDVQLIKALGLKKYRFSISWSRVLPYGTKNPVNPLGVQYYHNLINELLANGIEPMVTMYHWDLPEVLSQKGGWLNRDIVDWFTDYADLLFSEYGSKVKYWMTFNEPVVVSNYGYCGLSVVSAPGNFSLVCPWTKYLSGHHQILAHAKAYDLYNRKYRFGPKGYGNVGIVLASAWYEALDPNNAEDVAATDRAKAFSGLNWFAYPLFKGDYPPLMKQYIAERSAADGHIQSRLPVFTEEEKKLLKGGLYGKLFNGGKSADWLGINYYYSFTNVTTRKIFAYGIAQEDYDAAVNKTLQQPWPTGLRSLLNAAYAIAKVPVMVTENGLGVPAAQDSLNDQPRIDFIRNHLIQTLLAKKDGADIFGYTVWSLMDNLEWSSGFTSKYGLHHVDFTKPDRPRTRKASADWYTQVVAQRYVDQC